VLSVILTILKVIGIVLAVLVGLILLIVILVGFVPIRYKGDALYPYEGNLDAEVISRRKRDMLMSRVKTDDGGENSEETQKKVLKLKADAVVSWLLHIVHVSFKMDDTGNRLTVRLFGIFKIYSDDPETVRKKEEKRKKKEEKRRKKEEKKERKERKKKEETDTEKQLVKKEDGTADNPAEEKKEIIVADDERNAEKKDADSVSENKEDTKDTDSDDLEENDDDGEQTSDGKKKSIEEKLKNIYNKFDGIRKKVNYIKETAEDKRVKNGIAYGKKKLFLIIKRLLPKKLRGHVAFGMEDPAATGYITGGVSLFYGLWAGHFTVEPDFENKKLEADVDLKGRIVIAFLVIPALKVWFNKDIKYIRRKVDGFKKV